MNKNEFEEELKMDYYAEQRESIQEANLQNKLMTDYDFFLEYFKFPIQQAFEGMAQIKQLHKDYGHEFVCKEFED